MDTGVNLGNINLNNLKQLNNINKVSNLNQYNPNNLVSNVDKSVFLKMFSQVMNENNATNKLSDTSSELNILDMISGNNLSNLNIFNLDNVNLGDEAKLEAFLSEIETSIGNNKDEIKTQTRNDLENFMSMINYFDVDNKITSSEKLDLSYLSNYTTEKNVSINANKPQVMSMPISNFDENGAIGTSVIMENVENTENTFKTSLSVQAEKLISEIEGNRENFKKEIDYNAQLLSGRQVVYGDNKIITLSDESSKIKSQVMTQVKDKIVFMAEEGKDSGNIKQVDMELQPHNLGKVKIKMIFENDKITVEIKALNEETQNILSSNIDELTKTLSKITESSISVVVKSNESPFEQHISQQYASNEQRQNDNYDQEHSEHHRQRNQYYQQNNENDSEEESIFSQLINLRNLKLQ